MHLKESVSVYTLSIFFFIIFFNWQLFFVVNYIWLAIFAIVFGYTAAVFLHLFGEVEEKLIKRGFLGSLVPTALIFIVTAYVQRWIVPYLALAETSPLLPPTGIVLQNNPFMFTLVAFIFFNASIVFYYKNIIRDSMTSKKKSHI